MQADILSEFGFAENWPIYGVIAAGAVATLAAFLIGRRFTAPVAAPSAPPVDEQPADDPFETGSKGERRLAARRKGANVQVEISDPDLRLPPQEGWVQDRSIGGMCVVGLRNFAAGTRLKIRPKYATKLAPWVDVEVRSCHPGETDYWLSNCAFVKSPPYSVLLMFG